MVEGRDRRPELGYKLALELKRKQEEQQDQDLPENGGDEDENTNGRDNGEEIVMNEELAID